MIKKLNHIRTNTTSGLHTFHKIDAGALDCLQDGAEKSGALSISRRRDRAKTYGVSGCSRQRVKMPTYNSNAIWQLQHGS